MGKITIELKINTFGKMKHPNVRVYTKKVVYVLVVTFFGWIAVNAFTTTISCEGSTNQMNDNLYLKQGVSRQTARGKYL